MGNDRWSYTFAILRYTHDVVTGEFANVGIVLYAPSQKYLGARCVTAYGRLSRFFGDVNGESLKRLMAKVEGAIGQLDHRLFDHLPLSSRPKDALECARTILPPDDSSLAFFRGTGGFAAGDPSVVLDRLFERYVARYASLERPDRRHDAEIWQSFKKPLQERQLVSRLTPKVIRAPDYEHEFPHAWKNGVWHAADTVSFDLTERGRIVEKANRWLGRGVNLRESSEKFVLYLLLGLPADRRLMPAFENAVKILRKMPVEHRLVTEDEAPAFARMVEETLVDD